MARRIQKSHLLEVDTNMTPPVGVTAGQYMRVAPPSDGAAHRELRTVSSAQSEHSD